MKPYIDLTDVRFGHLVAKGRGWHEQSNTAQWRCLCDCGTWKVVPAGALRSGKVKSCGCRRTAGRRKDITGQQFGRLTILGFHDMAPNRVSRWKARCQCGKELIVRKSNLHKRNTVSCGCHRQDIQRTLKTVHGEAAERTKEYVCWQNMNQRCSNPASQRWNAYGGRGIRVCEAWRHDFSKFLEDVGRAPFPEACIDRIDVNGHYEPGNVRWVDVETSNRNKQEN